MTVRFNSSASNHHNDTMPRINVYVRAQHEARVRDAVARSGLPMSNLVEAMALCLSPQEIQGLCARYADLRDHESRVLGALRDGILAHIQTLHLGQLQALRDHVRSMVSAARDEPCT